MFARLLVVLAGLGAPALAVAQPATPEKQAYRRGEALFEQGNYARAIESFEEAYRLKPHFLLQCNIARCHELADDMVKAAHHYRRCLSEGGDKTKRAAELQAALADVESKIAWIEVSTDPAGGTIYVDGTDAGPAPGRIAMKPGSHAVEVRREGATARTTVVARAGDKLAVSLIPVAAKKPPSRRLARLRPHWFWAAAAATVVCAAVAIGVGAATLSARDDYEKDPTQDSYDRGITRRTVTNVFWGLSAAALGATAVLFVFTDFKGERARPSATAFGVGLGGTF